MTEKAAPYNLALLLGQLVEPTMGTPVTPAYRVEECPPKFVPTQSQRMRVLGNTVFADVISYIKMRSYWIRVDPKCILSMAFLVTEDTETYTPRGKGLHEDEGRDRSSAATGQRMPRLVRSQQRLGGGARKGPPQNLQRERGSADTWTSHFPPPEE